MYNRPKAGETERDILESQRKFTVQSEGFVPAAKIVPRPARIEAEEKWQPTASSRSSLVGDIVEKNTNAAEKHTTVRAHRSVSIFAKRTRKTERSFIVRDDRADEIHRENQRIVNSMSEDEIVAERERLMATVDPKILEYVQSLRRPLPEAAPQLPPEPQPLPVQTDKIENDVTAHPDSERWLHFDELESDKMEWMKSFPDGDNNPQPSHPYEARFDFHGRVLPYSLEYDERTRSLFHHSQEAHRPGYSLEELFTMARSTVLRQRVVALNSLAGVCDVHNDDLDVPVTKIFFVLRYALDENVLAVAEAAAKGLKNLLWYDADETCLDNIIYFNRGSLQPAVEPDKQDGDGGGESTQLKDFHVAELDLIEGYVRTDIPSRLQYVLNVLKPRPPCVDDCLKILIKIGRHSVAFAEKICNTPGLLKGIFDDYLPSASVCSSSPLNRVTVTALKLCRILISQSKNIAETFEKTSSLIGHISQYIISNDANSIFLIRIQIESSFVLSSYLHYKMGFECASSLLPSLLKLFHYSIEAINFNCFYQPILYSHATSILCILNSIAVHLDMEKDNTVLTVLGDMVMNAMSKWISQISTIDTLSFPQMCLISTLFSLTSSLIETKASIANRTSDLISIIVKMLDSNCFQKMASRLCESSNLLSIPIEKKNLKTPSNVLRLNSILSLENIQFVPCVSETSPVNFFCCISKCLLSMKDPTVIDKLLNNTHVLKYIRKVSDASQFNLQNNWLTRFEFDNLLSIVYLSTHTVVPEETMETIYNIAFKLSYLLPPIYVQDVEYLMKFILFDGKYLTLHRCMSMINTDKSFSALPFLDRIEKLYVSHFHSVLKSYQCDMIDTNSLTATKWNQSILPRDWLYLPLVTMYTESLHMLDDSKPSKSPEQKYDDVLCCLKWIITSEVCFPAILNDIESTNRFCRLMCVFLLDNSLFLDVTIKSHLYECFRNVFRFELNFDSPLDGIGGGFQDFYTQLLNQFQAVSYGDHLFAACVLAPLAQRHDVKWRKLVWSEYAGCLRFLDCPVEMLCYPLDGYLHPVETDLSLLKCYHRTLASNMLRSESVVFKIATHHIDAVKKRNVKC